MVKKSKITQRQKENIVLLVASVAFSAGLIYVSTQDPNQLALAFWTVAGAIVLLRYAENRTEETPKKGAKSSKAKNNRTDFRLSKLLTKILLGCLLLFGIWATAGIIIFVTQ